MASRLYPGFGTGKGAYDGHFEVKSLVAAGRSDLEAGDKVILPTSSLKEISRLKLPFPLLFKVSNDRLKTANTVPSKDGKMPAPATAEQYAGLMEFSAPDGVAYIPQWMMANLKLREGGKVGFATAPRGLPQASFAKFRPHQQAFVDLAAEIGPRDLLEAAMRNYSVLSEGERIIVDVADVKYSLDVLEVRPGGAATLYGDLDLEVEFAPLKGSPEDLAHIAAVAEEHAVLAGAAAVKAAEAAAAKVGTAKVGGVAKPGVAGAAAGAKAGPLAVAGTKAGAATPTAKRGAPPAPGVKRAAGGGIAAIRAVTAMASGAASSASGGRAGVASPASRPSTPSGKAAGSTGGAAVASPRPGSAARGVGAVSAAAAAGSKIPSPPGKSAPSVSQQIAANVAAAIAEAKAAPSTPKRSAGGPGGGAVRSPASLMSPLPSGGGIGRYVGAPPSTPFDGGAPMVSEESLDHPFVQVHDSEESTVPGSAGSASALAHGPPGSPGRGGGGVAAPEAHVYEGVGYRLGGKVEASPRKTPTKMGGAGGGVASPRPAGVMSPAAQAKAAASAAAAVEAEKRRERELRARAAMARLAAPPPSGDAAVAPPASTALAAPFVTSAVPGSVPSSTGGGAATTRGGTSVASTTLRRGGEEEDAASLHSAPLNPDGTRTCQFCKTDVTGAAFDIHVLRCRRHKAYHRSHCVTCNALVANKDAAAHVHCAGCGDLVPVPAEGADGKAANVEAAIAAHANTCPERIVKCECGAEFAARLVDGHRDTCPSALETCAYCRVKHKRSAIGAHQDKCGSRTAACERCGKQVVLKGVAAHAAPGGACDALIALREAKAAAKAAALAAAAAEAEAKARAAAVPAGEGEGKEGGGEEGSEGKGED